MLYAPTCKNLALPIVMYPPLSGRLEGVCDTPLPGYIKKERSDNKKVRYQAKLPGLGEALIFFSHPFPRIKARKGWIPEKN